MAQQWVIFDMMGVIFEVGDLVRDLLVPFIQQRRADMTAEAIDRLFFRASCGEISADQVWEAVGLGRDYPHIETAYLESYVSLDPAFVDIADQLRSRYSLGVLSNDVSAWSKFIRQKYHLDRLFSTVVISGDTGYMKPDPRIYTRLLNQLPSAPSVCVFIDDRLENLEPASELGMRTIWFAREETAHSFRPDRILHTFLDLPAMLATF